MPTQHFIFKGYSPRSLLGVGYLGFPPQLMETFPPQLMDTFPPQLMDTFPPQLPQKYKPYVLKLTVGLTILAFKM